MLGKAQRNIFLLLFVKEEMFKRLAGCLLLIFRKMVSA